MSRLFRIQPSSPKPAAGWTVRFGSFSAAADENARSRILVGFHFRAAVEAGTAHGEKIGRFVVEHALRPLRGGAAVASR